MHGDIFGEYPGNEPLPRYGGDSPRHVVEVSFEVAPEGDGAALWVWGHHIGFQYFWDHFEWNQGAGNFSEDTTIQSSYDAPYDGRAKAAVRLNGGAWIPLNNDHVTCARVEEAQHCIGGLAAAARFRVDGAQLRAGENTVEFAYLGHDMLSSGYRILDLAALPAGYSGSLSHRDVRPIDQITTRKREEDPLTWTAPEGSDPARGADLWHNAELHDFPGAGTIEATCNDCHAEAGRDMKYFNYSNESLIVRSQFHGLSAQDGKDIAAYIRGYVLEDADGQTYPAPGRPWNPPYQPGPRLAAAGTPAAGMHPDEAPAQYWAAGSGLEWIADDEMTVLAYLAPDGTADHDAGPFVQPGGIQVSDDLFDYDAAPLNMREIPLSIQLPDWNRWLPIIHPKDAYGVSYYENSRGVQEYQAARANIAAERAAGKLSEVERLTHRVAWRGRESFRYGPLRDAGTAWNRYQGRANRGGQQWIAVKQWELHHEYDLAGWIHTQDPDREARTWGRSGRAIFDIASHIMGDQDYLDGRPLKTGVHMTHLWYHYQLILNPGIGSDRATGQTPVDWNYHFAFSRGHDGTGLPSFARWMSSWIKLNQFMVTHHGVASRDDRDNGGPGFNNHRHGLYNIWRFYSSPSGSAAMPDDLANLFLNRMLASWVRIVESFPIDSFLRGDYHRNRWGLPTDRPTLRTLRHTATTTPRATITTPCASLTSNTISNHRSLMDSPAGAARCGRPRKTGVLHGARGFNELVRGCSAHHRESCSAGLPVMCVRLPEVHDMQVCACPGVLLHKTPRRCVQDSRWLVERKYMRVRESCAARLPAVCAGLRDPRGRAPHALRDLSVPILPDTLRQVLRCRQRTHPPLSECVPLKREAIKVYKMGRIRERSQRGVIKSVVLEAQFHDSLHVLRPCQLSDTERTHTALIKTKRCGTAQIHRMRQRRHSLIAHGVVAHIEDAHILDVRR